VGVAVNLTGHAVTEVVAHGSAGELLWVVIIKASYQWMGAPELVPAAAAPIELLDRYTGDPAGSGLAAASEVGLPKPRVDVLVTGELRFAAPITQALVGLEVGARLAKQVQVFGDRRWVLASTRNDLVPSRPAPIAALPIGWERAAGGSDPSDASLRDPRNPVGCTQARGARELQGKPLPNFEDPRQLLATWRDRPAPQGFGPVAPHWEARARLAGTYDQRWMTERAPLLPPDFDPAFYNCAPADQQLGDYRPGEEVRLTGMTPRGRERFVLPALEVPVLFVTRDLMNQTRARVDTIVIEPAEARVSLIARAVSRVRPSAAAMRQIFVGPLSRGRRRALETGRRYLDLRVAIPRAPE
jgi:hypothetical protein